jgi:DNA-directed RNA polymerase sigma subunit (sigma70/sigma32)
MTAAEAAAELGMGLSAVLTILENVPMLSLDKTTADGETTIGEQLDDADRLWVSVQSWCTDEVLRLMAADLSPPELSAFGMRHGLCEDRVVTYTEMGDIFGRSEESVRRHAEAANKKVRAWILTHKPDLAAHRRKAARLERIELVEESRPTTRP